MGDNQTGVGVRPLPPELWPAFTRPDRGTLARLHVGTTCAALKAKKAFIPSGSLKRARVPRSAHNLEMRPVMSKNLGAVQHTRNRPALPARVQVTMASADPRRVLWPTERMRQRLQPVTGIIYMSAALLSTSLYVFIVPDTTTEEGRNRRKAGNTIDFFTRVQNAQGAWPLKLPAGWRCSAR